MKSTMKWILHIIMTILPNEAILDLIIKVLRDLAKRTENTIDDAAVEIIAEILYGAFGKDRKEKMIELDQQFGD
ncbi:MAG TPA: hypothetical protein PKZ69_00175 [Candidatus Cloacimonadota bacterium]|nr:hypothetical protein [Candidatus Cloacimonadota bacterium]